VCLEELFLRHEDTILRVDLFFVATSYDFAANLVELDRLDDSQQQIKRVLEKFQVFIRT
jgi:hypothetical protein